MLKKIIVISICMLSVTACEKIETKVLNVVEEYFPKETNEQNQKSAVLFDAFVQKDSKKIYGLVDANLQKEFDKQPEIFEDLFKLIPSEDIPEAEVIGVTKGIDLPAMKFTKISYKYPYSTQDLIFSVVYRGHDDSTDIVGLWITPVEKAS